MSLNTIEICKHKLACIFLCLILAVQILPGSSQASGTSGTTRIKDLVEFRGVRSNPLVGLGLVVGLPGTGDSRSNLATNKAAVNLFSKLGFTVGASELTTKNLAIVAVSADLPAFARNGDKLDIRLSAIGDAASLEGGTLLLTPLSAADDNIYAVAQGAISQGFSMSGAQGGGVSRSSAPKTIAMAKSATVEKEFQSSFQHQGNIELSLKNADFTTAARVSKTINDFFSEFLAEAENAGLIKVRIPEKAKGNKSFSLVTFVSALEQLPVESDEKSIVVINERTGTVIAGQNVTVSPVAISHGNLEIVIDRNPKMVGEIPQTTTVGDLVRALNAFGAGPRDLVSILQSLEVAKAIKAEIKIL